MLVRRKFLNSVAASVGSLPFLCTQRLVSSELSPQQLDEKLNDILRSPVLQLAHLSEPVIIESIDLLRNGNTFLLRTRSTTGLEVITVPHQSKMRTLYPILLKSVIPAFLNRDGREIENLLWEVYRHDSNYKMQGLAFWVCVAAVEMGILELLSQAGQTPLANLFGGVRKRDIGVYFASGNRGNRPEQEIEYLQSLVENSGARALKFRLGGRMNRNVDSLPGRSESLIALARKTFGDQMVLYADSNSSYDAQEAIRIGKLMEENDFGFYEEPCEFDDLWSTKTVADALTIPVAGGEQEYSLHRWKWVIANRGVDIVQPDLHYGGGFIRAVLVAKMAECAGMSVVPHMSGGGLGYVEVVHFASFVPNAGPYMEFKGNASLPVHCDSSQLRAVGGQVRSPSGTGFGVTIDPDFVAKSQIVLAG
ncbi:MAG: mandelate racemase/muconate lactonizing enzyme family protein [Planctomycetales bacterium]|nr:mandelate racemase/muconate lactonizing enzyme family protein [Planctomycetales bacterium]